MEGIKRCARCYQVISCIDSSDWYSHLSVKYCDSCREIVKKEQSAARVKAFRQRKRISDKEKDLTLDEHQSRTTQVSSLYSQCTGSA